MKVNNPNQCLKKIQQEQQQEKQQQEEQQYQEQLTSKMKAEVDAIQKYLRENQEILTQKLVFRQQVINERLFIFFELPKSSKLKLIKLDVEQLVANQAIFLKLIKSQLLKDFGYSFHNMFFSDIVDKLNEYIRELKDKTCIVCLEKTFNKLCIWKCQISGCTHYFCKGCQPQIEEYKRCFYCRK